MLKVGWAKTFLSLMHKSCIRGKFRVSVHPFLPTQGCPLIPSAYPGLPAFLWGWAAYTWQSLYSHILLTLPVMTVLPWPLPEGPGSKLLAPLSGSLCDWLSCWSLLLQSKMWSQVTLLYTSPWGSVRIWPSCLYLRHPKESISHT